MKERKNCCHIVECSSRFTAWMSFSISDHHMLLTYDASSITFSHRVTSSLCVLLKPLFVFWSSSHIFLHLQYNTQAIDHAYTHTHTHNQIINLESWSPRAHQERSLPPKAWRMTRTGPDPSSPWSPMPRSSGVKRRSSWRYLPAVLFVVSL